MTEKKPQGTRREFLKKTGQAAAATTLLTSAAPRVHAAEDNSLRVVLIGCGGRGTGAALNALSVENGPHLIALADVAEKNLNSTDASLSLVSFYSVFRACCPANN